MKAESRRKQTCFYADQAKLELGLRRLKLQLHEGVVPKGLLRILHYANVMFFCLKKRLLLLVFLFSTLLPPANENLPPTNLPYPSARRKMRRLHLTTAVCHSVVGNIYSHSLNHITTVFFQSVLRLKKLA